jgi:hypothetical protein
MRTGEVSVWWAVAAGEIAEATNDKRRAVASARVARREAADTSVTPGPAITRVVEHMIAWRE